MENEKKKFCDDLKDFFSSQGITQQMLADRLKVSQQRIAALLNGASTFGKKTASQWASEFGLPELWLLKGEGSLTTIGIVQNNEHGDNYQGDGMTVNHSDAKFLALLKKKDEQIDRLLAIIEKLQSK